MGAVDIVGATRSDASPPTIDITQASPSTADTLPGPVTIDVSVHAVDAGSGVGAVYAMLKPLDDDSSSPRYVDDNLQLTDGNEHDGTWTGSITLPQGLP